MKSPGPRRWSSPRSHAVSRAGLLAVLAFAGCTDGAPWGDQRRSPAAADDPADHADQAPPRVATAPSHGFNDAIAWRNLEEGLAEAKAAGRPLMLVVHASWCSRCKELKPKFHEERLTELSERFVMVNADQDLTPAVLAYGPDGQYLPRVLFLDPTTGAPDPALQNPSRDRYHYYWGPQDDLEGMMEKALARHGKS